MATHLEIIQISPPSLFDDVPLEAHSVPDEASRPEDDQGVNPRRDISVIAKMAPLQAQPTATAASGDAAVLASPSSTSSGTQINGGSGPVATAQSAAVVDVVSQTPADDSVAKAAVMHDEQENADAQAHAVEEKAGEVRASETHVSEALIAHESHEAAAVTLAAEIHDDTSATATPYADG